jgi:hypothetical protein
MRKFNLFFIAFLGFIFSACMDGNTDVYFQLVNKTHKEVIVKYQYSDTELRTIKVPVEGSSFIWHESYISPDYKPDNATIEQRLSKIIIYQTSNTDTIYLPVDEYTKADKWIRSATYDMSTTSAFYTLSVDNTMFIKE